MTQGEAIDGTPTAPDPGNEDAEPDESENAGTAAEPDEEDLQSPPLDVDELPAH
ncbi:MAG TPA: hypothetical protein VMU65_09085 [Candidatus Saccharimonadales bacterium]|nr:hypothetical protein [Candidatus Saccharimonadales bacterium]